MEFYKLIRKCGYDRAGIAKYLHVTTATIKRWEDSNKPPRAVFLLLNCLAGQLGFLPNEFEGFYFFEGELYTPENQAVRAGEIRAIKFNQQTINFYREKDKRKSVRHDEDLKIIQFKPLNSRK